MGGALLVLGSLFSIVSLVGAVMLTMQAWKDEWWKGALCFCCFPYGLYYGFSVLQHEKKNLIMGLYAGGWAGSLVFQMAGQAMM